MVIRARRAAAERRTMLSGGSVLSVFLRGMMILCTIPAMGDFVQGAWLIIVCKAVCWAERNVNGEAYWNSGV